MLTQTLLLSEKKQQEELLQRVLSLDQQLQAQSEALDKVMAAKDELRLELEKEMEEKKKLAQQVNLLCSPKLSIIGSLTLSIFSNSQHFVCVFIDCFHQHLLHHLLVVTFGYVCL